MDKMRQKMAVRWEWEGGKNTGRHFSKYYTHYNIKIQ